jgi:hypothetical protein
MSLPRWKPDLIVTKDPDAELDYGFGWTEWLADVPAGEDPDTISSSSWIVSGADSELSDADATHDETTTTVWLSGGTVGITYTVTNRIVTAGGRTEDRSMQIRIVEK